MKVYKFKIRNIGLELPEPTIESFEKVFDELLMKFFICDEMKEMMKKDLQILIDTKSYEIIEKDNITNK